MVIFIRMNYEFKIRIWTKPALLTDAPGTAVGNPIYGVPLASDAFRDVEEVIY